jgi:hypothetical protein
MAESYDGREKVSALSPASPPCTITLTTPPLPIPSAPTAGAQITQ